MLLGADYMTFLVPNIGWYWTRTVGVIWKCNGSGFFFKHSWQLSQ